MPPVLLLVPLSASVQGPILLSKPGPLMLPLMFSSAMLALYRFMAKETLVFSVTVPAQVLELHPPTVPPRDVTVLGALTTSALVSVPLPTTPNSCTPPVPLA